MRRMLTVLATSAALVAGLVVVAPLQQAQAAGVSVAFDQCANGGSPSTATFCQTGWTNGSLGTANSHYSEDQVVPQRIQATAQDTGTHTIGISYQVLKNGIHAYDSLATWNVTEFTADACQGLTPTLCTANPPTTFQMAPDNNSEGTADTGISTTVSPTHELPQTSRLWTAYNGAVTATSPVTFAGDTAFVTITFQALTSGSPVIIVFGAHLAVSGGLSIPRAWGLGLGASNISGGPYQTKIESIDGGGGGAANSIKAGALVPGVPHFTITKSANPTTATAGQTTVTYTITVTNDGTGPGVATFTDNFDDRLTPTTPTSSPTGGTCDREPSGTDRYFTCGTIQLAAGSSQTFTYTAVMPTGFTTGQNTGGCTGGTYPVTNTATLATGGTPGTATVCVTAAPQFTVTKTADESTVNPGDTIHYHVTVTNTGSSAGSTTFTDDYDDRLTITAPTGCTLTTTGTPANKIMNCTTGTINALVPPATTGNTQVFDYTGVVPATFSGDPGTGCSTGQFAISNSATLTSVSTGNSGTTTVCVNAVPSFTIAKSATPNPTTPGHSVSYTVTVTNGGAAAGSTSFTDVYDSRISPSAVTVTGGTTAGSCVNSAATHTLSCTTGTIPGDDGSNSGANKQIFTYTANMPGTFDAPGTGCNAGQYAVPNTATLHGETTGITNTVCVTAAPALTVTKSFSPTTGVKAGDTVTYTLTVDNTLGTASGSTTVVDNYDDRLDSSITAPAGCQKITVGTDKELSCDSGTVLAGATKIFTYTATMPATFDGPSGQGGCDTGTFPVSNSVVLSVNGANDSKTVCVAASPTLSILKSFSPANPAQPGDLITYVVTVKNTGTAQGSQAFVDNYDDRISPSAVTVDPAGGNGCTQTTIPTNDKVLSCDSGIIPAKSQRTFTYSANMPGTFTAAGTGCPAGQYAVPNSANFTGATTNPATATVCVTAAPSFSITKVADPVDANPGQSVTYTITVTNGGKASGSTTFTDDYDNRLDSSITAPAGCTKVSGTLQCTTGTISADTGNNTQVFTYTATMPATFSVLSPTAGCGAPRGKYSVTNTATLTGSNTGSPSSGTATVCVNASPTFTITKSASPNPADAGSPVIYTVTVTNGGTAPGSTTFVDDYDDRLNITPPAGCTLGTTGTAPNLNKVMNCTTGTIGADPPNNTQVFTYTVNMPGTFNGGAGTGGCGAGQYPVSNRATLANGLYDPVTVCVNAAPSFTVHKSASPTTVKAGDSVTYTIVVTNGGTASGSTTFVDNYDDRLDVTAPAGCTLGTTGTAPNTDKVLNCTTGTILADAPNNTQTFTYTVTLPATFTGTPGGSDCGSGKYPVMNLVTLANGQSDPVKLCVSAAPTFTVDKTVTPTSGVVPGGMITYHITITNTGTAPGSTTFIDDYDDRLTLGALTTDPTGGSCIPGLDPNNSSNHIQVCTTSTIEAKQTQVFTYTATVPTDFTGPSGTGGCDPGSFPITNSATLTSVSVGSKSATTCVSASPDFMVQKSASATVVGVNQTVTYHLLVTNTGHAPGVATIQDNYDDRLTPTNFPLGCSLGTINNGDKVLNCTTNSLDPHGSQDITYDVTTPSYFSGDPGTGCGPGQYALHNSVRFVTPTDTGDSLTVCVNAAPSFTVTKTVVTAGPYTPGQNITYRITVTNGGTAAGSTSFTDNYDDRLTVTPPAGCTLGTINNGDKVLNCTTGTITADPGNNHDNTQVFTYTVTLPATFDGGNGTGGCSTGQYPVTNSVTLSSGGGDGATVCVNAAPNFTITKVANPTTTDAGKAVTYTITVTNGGTASGSTSFTDNYDDRLTISTVTSNPAGAQCVNTTTGDKVLSCSTGTILADPGHNTQTFTYSANMPPSFAGIAGGADCSAVNPQQYPVTNSAQLANGLPATATVCVNAAPVAKLVKSVVKVNNTDGSEDLAYTITYTNTGTAASNTTAITDAIPSGTTFASCGGCVTSGSPVAFVSWPNIGPVAALGGTGTVTLNVHVIATAVCQITNIAYIQFDTNTPVASNPATITIDPLPNPAGAHASGSAIGAQVKLSGIVGINLGPIGQASTVRNGLGPTQTANKTVLGVSLPANGSLVRIPVVNETSASGVSANPPFAQDVTSAAVDHVCLMPIGNICTVQADTVQAVASTLATGAWATYSSGGSTIQNLKIVGIPTVVDLNTTVKINLNPLIFGAGSYVAINERTGSAGLVGSTYVANAQVTLIHLVVTGLLNLQAANVIVSQATSHADFPQTLLCGNTPHQSVSGHAFVAQLRNAPTLADTTLGYVAIPPTGANETQQIVGVQVPLGILGASVGASRSFSNMSPSLSYAESSAEIAGNNGTQICVVKLSPTSCLITANLIHSQSQSTAGPAGAVSTDAGTSLANVSVAGIPIGVTIPPNLAIIIPGMGYVVLNEQMCDGGGLTYNHKCTGTHHSGLTVRAVDLVFTFLGSGLGVVPATQLIIGEAHSDATYGA